MLKYTILIFNKQKLTTNSAVGHQLKTSSVNGLAGVTMYLQAIVLFI